MAVSLCTGTRIKDTTEDNADCAAATCTAADDALCCREPSNKFFFLSIWILFHPTIVVIPTFAKNSIQKILQNFLHVGFFFNIHVNVWIPKSAPQWGR